jgi:hypothetical protein
MNKKRKPCSGELVNDRLNGATHDRRNGATRKCPKSDLGGPFKLGIFTSFLGHFFCSLTTGFWVFKVGFVER